MSIVMEQNIVSNDKFYIKCELCTFDNEPFADKCYICGSPLQKEKEEEEEEEEEENKKIKCKKCTFENELDTKVCVVCNYNLKLSKEVSDNIKKAYSSNPEFFFSVTMLHFNCTINGQTVRVLVDSGAQITVMSSNIMKACNLDNILDIAHKGVCKGVGQQEILGKINYQEIFVETKDKKMLCLPCSFSVINTDNIDILFGLDMLKGHAATIDFAKGILTIGQNIIQLD